MVAGSPTVWITTMWANAITPEWGIARFLRYRDLAVAATSWLWTKLGFKRHVIACVFTDDAEPHYAHARPLGTEIVQHTTGHGDGRQEGNVWTFREFEVWSHQPERRHRRWAALITALSALLSILVIGSTVALGYLHASAYAVPLSRKVPPSSEQSMKALAKARFSLTMRSCKRAWQEKLRNVLTKKSTPSSHGNNRRQK